MSSLIDKLRKEQNNSFQPVFHISSLRVMGEKKGPTKMLIITYQKRMMFYSYKNALVK